MGDAVNTPKVSAKTEHRATLTEGPVGRQLLGLAGPMTIGLFSVIAFNVVDTWFVSRLGSEELAALGFTFPVVMVVGSISLGLGIGATSVIARAIGAGDTERVRRLATDALLLGLGIVLVLDLLGAFTIAPLFRALGADDSTLPHIEAYMKVWYLGMIFLVVPMMGNAVIRAGGDTRTPATIMVVAGLGNGILDPIFIFGLGPIPPMGVQGAALATVLSRALTLILALWILVVREKVITWSLPSPRVLLGSWREVLKVGAPATANSLALPITVAVLTGLVARQGTHYVAAYGAGSRVEVLAALPLMALGAGMSPFVGQNWGAGRKDRIREALSLCGRFVLIWGSLAALLLFLGSAAIAGAFSKDPRVVVPLTFYLRCIPLGYVAFGAQIVAVSTFNASGHPLRASALSLSRAPILVLGLGSLGARLFGAEGIFVGLVVASLLTGSLGWLWVGRLSRE